MGRWALARGLHPWAAALAGFVAPLTGAVFPHLYAGHLSNLCTMAWAPWIFLGLEAWTRHGGHRWLLLASAAACFQILAGQLQYCFFTAVAAGLQATIVSVTDPAARRRALPAVALCYLGATALGAAQLLPAATMAAEGIRQQKLDYTFASRFSFPPENFLTTIAPAFFGGLRHAIYWGRFYFWEMSLFIGASGLVLIAVALFDRNRLRELSCDLVLIGLLLVLALGAYTPLFNPLYDFAPGFGHFRGWSKFIFPATLFLVLIIAAGADTLLRGSRPAPQVALGGVLLGFAAIGVGAFLTGWPQDIKVLFPTVMGQNYLPVTVFRQPEFVRHAGTLAGLSLGLTGVILLASGTILFLLKRWPFLRWGVPGFLLIEMLGFAAAQTATSHLSDAMPDSLRQFVAEHPGDYRVLNVLRPNNGFLLGASDLAGHNPAILRRYAEFINFSQGDDPDQATQDLSISKIHPRYSMLRLRYIFEPSPDGYRVIESPYPPLPRLLLVSDWRALDGRDAIFSALNDPLFDPSKTVLMESEPEPRPEFGARGSVALTSVLPDALTIEVDTNKPTLLLITDLYERGWRAEPLSGSVQQSYRVMPADYILRVVPLMAGHHRLRVVYAPPEFLVGISISAVAWTLWVVMFCFAPSSIGKTDAASHLLRQPSRRKRPMLATKGTT